MRFFDFGDAVLSDPLGVLLATLELHARSTSTATPDDPRLAAGRRRRDRGVERPRVPPAELRAALPASLQLGKLARSESWARCLTHLTDEEMEEFGDSRRLLAAEHHRAAAVS